MQQNNSLKNLMSTTFGCKDMAIRKFEFVANTHILLTDLKWCRRRNF